MRWLRAASHTIFAGALVAVLLGSCSENERVDFTPRGDALVLDGTMGLFVSSDGLTELTLCPDTTSSYCTATACDGRPDQSCHEVRRNSQAESFEVSVRSGGCDSDCFGCECDGLRAGFAVKGSLSVGASSATVRAIFDSSLNPPFVGAARLAVTDKVGTFRVDLVYESARVLEIGERGATSRGDGGRSIADPVVSSPVDASEASVVDAASEAEASIADASDDAADAQADAGNEFDGGDDGGNDAGATADAGVTSDAGTKDGGALDPVRRQRLTRTKSAAEVCPP